MNNKRFITVTAFFVLGIGAALVLLYNSDKMLSEKFVNKWSEIFFEIKNTADFKKINLSNRPDLIVQRFFKDGSWFVGVCNGYSENGWSASVFMDSSMHYYKSYEIISGYESLYGMIYNADANSLKEFMPKFGLQLIEIRKKGISPAAVADR